jgi:hypothetical protein
MLERFLQPFDFIAKPSQPPGDREVIHKENGPNGQVRGHQAIEIFHRLPSESTLRPRFPSLPAV